MNTFLKFYVYGLLFYLNVTNSNYDDLDEKYIDNSIRHIYYEIQIKMMDAWLFKIPKYH